MEICPGGQGTIDFPYRSFYNQKGQHLTSLLLVNRREEGNAAKEGCSFRPFEIVPAGDPAAF